MMRVMNVMIVVIRFEKSGRGRTGLQGTGEISDGSLLIAKRRGRLVVEPSELLEDLGVVGGFVEHTVPSISSALVLHDPNVINERLMLGLGDCYCIEEVC
jgi:hypothetical protein